MAFLSCPYLGADVELSEERERHIRNIIRICCQTTVSTSSRP
jgi:hypothetical protein